MENPHSQPASAVLRLDGGRTGWIFLHDLAYTPLSLLPLAHRLQENTGDTICLPPLPAPSPGDASRAAADAWVRSARTETLRLYESCQEVYAMGHGLGALLALQLAQELPLGGMILVAPSLHDPRAWAPLAKLVALFMPTLPHGDDAPEASARKKAVPTASLATVRQVRARVLSGLAGVQAPSRLFCPEEDPWCPKSSAEALAKCLPHCRFLPLPGSSHCCLTQDMVQKILSSALEVRKEHPKGGKNFA